MANYGLRRCERCRKPFIKSVLGPIRFCSDSCRFWHNVDVSSDDECWNWLLSKGKTGYGKFPSCPTEDGKALHSSHRGAYYYAYGAIPLSGHVLHTCDNRLCCNPKHLYIGDCQDNNRDKRLRFRAGKKLSVEQVRLIKSDPRPGTVVAKEYGVSPSCIWYIRKGKVWAAA